MPRATAATTPRTTQAAASPLARSPACAVPACRQRRTCFSLRSRASPTETACSANTTFSAAAPVSPRAPEGCQRARIAGAVAGAAGGVPLDFLGSVVASGSMRALATPDRTPAAAMAATGARRAEGRRWAAGFGLGRRRPRRSVGRGTPVARFVSVCSALPSCACPLCPFGGGPLRRVAQPAVFPARPRAPAAAAAATARRPLSVGLRARPWGVHAHHVPSRIRQGTATTPASARAADGGPASGRSTEGARRKDPAAATTTTTTTTTRSGRSRNTLQASRYAPRGTRRPRHVSEGIGTSLSRRSISVPQWRPMQHQPWRTGRGGGSPRRSSACNSGSRWPRWPVAWRSRRPHPRLSRGAAWRRSHPAAPPALSGGRYGLDSAHGALAPGHRLTCRRLYICGAPRDSRSRGARSPSPSSPARASCTTSN